MSHYRAPQTPGIDLDCDYFTPEEILVVQNIASLGDPEEDKILFWNERINAYDYLGIGSNLEINSGLLNVVGLNGDVIGPSDSINDDIVLFDGTTGKLIKDSGIGISSLVPYNNANSNVELGEYSIGVDSVRFDTSPSDISYQPGRLYWDDINKTIAIQTGIGDNTLQINQEIIVRVGNESGSDFIQPQIVRISGENGTLALPLTSLAIASSINSSDILGVLTTDLTSGVGNIGFATVLGQVNNVDTSGFNLNDTLYLSATIPGGLTNIKPVSPNFVRPIGKVSRVHSTEGVILVNTSISSSMDANQIFEDMINPNGFPEGQKANVNIAYDYNTRTVTVSGTFFYYNKGIKYIKTSVSEQVTHDDINGAYFIYYDGDTLTLSTTPFDFLRHVHVAYVIYNNTGATTFWNGKEGIIFDERHGMIMDGQTHLELHQTIGSYVKGGAGFSLNGTYSVATGSGGLIANSFGIDSGTIADEDLETLITTLNDAAGVGNIYPIFYRIGASNEWRWYKNNLPYLFSSTNILWNQFTGGAWQLTQSTTNGRYINYYVCATNSLNPDYRFVFIPSQTEHTSLANAQGENILSLDLTGLPFAEIVPLWQITWRREGAYDDNGNCRIESTRKVIGTRLTLATASVSVSNHNNLSNRSDPNSHPASAVSNIPSGNISSEDIQSAINELDTEKAPLRPVSEKTTLVDADEVTGNDSANSFLQIRTTWTNVKSFLKTYFDTLYATISGSISQAFSVSQLEVGHASDTTITRVSAGKIAVEGVNVVTTSSTDTLTNKTLTKPVINAIDQTDSTYSPSSAGTATLDCGVNNIHAIQMPAGNITIALSNITNNQNILIKIKQDSVGGRTVTWFSGITWAGGTAPTLTTGANKTDWIGITRTGTNTYIGVVVAQNI